MSTYYIGLASSHGASDSHNGARSTPFASVAKALTVVQPGDTVYFLAGTYRNPSHGDGNLWKAAGDVVLDIQGVQGSAGQPITFAAEPGAAVKLQFDGAAGVRIAAAQHIRVQGFEIEGPAAQTTLAQALAQQYAWRIDSDADGSLADEVSQFRDPAATASPTPAAQGGVRPSALAAYGVALGTGANHIELLDNRIHDAPAGAIRSTAGADYLLVRGNVLYNNLKYSAADDHVVAIRAPVSSDSATSAKIVVETNQIYDNQALLIPWSTSTGTAIARTITQGEGILVQAARAADGFTHGQVLVANNLVLRSGAAGIALVDAERVTLAHNTLVDNGRIKALIAANQADPDVAAGFDPLAGGLRLSGGDDLLVLNNLVVQASAALNVVEAAANITPATATLLNNQYQGGSGPAFGAGGADLATLQAGIASVASAGFINAAGGDHRLLRSSPAVNAGHTQASAIISEDVAGYVRFDGLPDVGAYEFVGDSIPPAAGALAIANQANAQDGSFDLVLTGQEGGSTVIYQRSADGGSSWVDTVAAQTNLPLGSYLFRARVSDVAGNLSTTPSVAAAVASTIAPPNPTPPAVPLIVAVQDDQAPGTGSLSAGAVTNDSQPVFSITAAQGSTVRVYDGSLFLGLAQPVAGTPGSFSFTPPSPLLPGPHSITARASDTLDQASAASAAWTLSVGATGDGTPLNPGSLTLTVSGKDNLADASFTLVAAGHPAGDTLAFEVFNGSTWLSTSANITNQPHGSTSYRVKVKQGSTSTNRYISSELVVAVDSAATPPVADINAPAAPVIGPLGGTSSLPVFTITAEAGASVKVFDGATLLGAASAGGAPGTFSYTMGTPLAAGAHAFYARATDAAGNVSAWSTAVELHVNAAPTGSVTVSGVAMQGVTLTSTHTLADPDGLGPLVWQWLADGNPIAGATSTSFTPTSAEVGKALALRASWNDGKGTAESVTSSATTAVIPPNNPPTLGTAIGAQNATEDSAFSFQVPAGAFIDADSAIGDTLTFTAALGDGSALPAWLSFNAATRTFSGTPLNAHVGTLSLRVTATDRAAASVNTSFNLVVANVNDVPTGTLTINGAATVGQTLQAQSSLADEDGLGTLAYQWKANGTNLSGATSANYTLTSNELGKTVTVTASYTDGRGGLESVTSTATAAVAPNGPTLGPAIGAKTATEEQAFSFEVPAGSFVNNLAGQALSYAATLGDGSALPAWLSFDAAAQRFSGTPANSDVAALTIKLTATNSAQVAISANFTLTVANVNDAPTGEVTISGTPTQGETLSVSSNLGDDDGLGNIVYQWKADGTAIAKATGESYKLTAAEVGKKISVTASYTDSRGTAEQVNSAATETVLRLNNAPKAGAAIAAQTATEDKAYKFQLATTALSDADKGDVLSFQATLEDGSDLPAWLSFAADTRTFTGTPLNADVAVHTLKVTATDTMGASAIQTFKLTVANANDKPSGAVTITGTATQGQTLTAEHTLEDEDGMGTVAWQWKANGSNIAKATEASYTLAAADVGKTITVTASFTDGRGTAESVTSAATAKVVAGSGGSTGGGSTGSGSTGGGSTGGSSSDPEANVPGLPGADGKTVAGDGNGDGIADSAQPEVSSMAFKRSDAANATSFVTIVAGSKAGKPDADAPAHVEGLAQKPAPATAPKALKLPVGLLSFSDTLKTSAPTLTMSVYVDSALKVNGYWKPNAAGTWVNLASEPYGGKVVTEGNKTRLDFVLTDGGPFDADGQVNGVIVEVGAPGGMPLSLAGVAPAMPADGFWF